MNKKYGRSTTARLTIIALLVVITLGITVVAALPYLRDRVQTQASAGASGNTGSDKSYDVLVTYNGKEYRYNSHLSNYLLLGTDTDENITEEIGKSGDRRTDSIFLLSYDRKDETVRIVAIPRDTMATITMYDQLGNSYGQVVDHLSLQYAYGDGREMSCKITRDAVSELLHGMPIIGYTAISLESIPLLVDTLGGVTLTVPDDSMEDVNPEYKKGAVITLTGENAESYLRHRDLYSHQQALVRMERQKSFINAFVARVLELQNKDPHTITDLYETLKPHMVTNMSNDIYLDLADAKRLGEIKTIPGKGVATDLYDEYHVDDEALYELILDIFYKEET